jgi:hypothetical protein
LIIDDEALIPYLGKGMVSELVWSGMEWYGVGLRSKVLFV